jgi:hypothetical protein
VDEFEMIEQNLREKETISIFQVRNQGRNQNQDCKMDKWKYGGLTLEEQRGKLSLRSKRSLQLEDFLATARKFSS